MALYKCLGINWGSTNLNRSPAAQKTSFPESLAETFSHRGLVVGHHHLRFKVREDLLDLLEEGLVHPKFPRCHHNREDADRFVVEVSNEVEHL